MSSVSGAAMTSQMGFCDFTASSDSLSIVVCPMPLAG